MVKAFAASLVVATLPTGRAEARSVRPPPERAPYIAHCMDKLDFLNAKRRARGGRQVARAEWAARCEEDYRAHIGH